MAVEPFYNLLCAGEERSRNGVGVKVLDTGDIKATLCGWTAIGYGQTPLSLISLPLEKTRDFVKKQREEERGLVAMGEALADLSVTCNPAEASRAAVLVSGPASEISPAIIKDLSQKLREVAPNAQQRLGDYPREPGILDVTVILSELAGIKVVEEFYRGSIELSRLSRERQRLGTAKNDPLPEVTREITSFGDHPSPE